MFYYYRLNQTSFAFFLFLISSVCLKHSYFGIFQNYILFPQDDVLFHLDIVMFHHVPKNIL